MILKCLTHDRAGRYASMKEVARDLRDAAINDLGSVNAAIARYETDLATVRTSANAACASLVAELRSDGLPTVPEHQGDHGMLTAAWQTCCDALTTH